MAALVNKVLVLLLLWGALFYTEASHDASQCEMADFPVQQDFDEIRFQGKWYEVSWIILPWIKPEWNYYDYIHIYTQTDYGFSVTAEGRWPFNATTCVEPTYPKLYRTGDNAKYIYEHMVNNSVLVNSTVWIVDTDYANYSLAIGCRDVAANGTCVAPDGWLWTRCQNKPRQHVEYMERRLPEFCLSVGQFHTSHHNTECRADIPDWCTAGGPGIQGAHVTSVTAYILTALLLMKIY